MAEKGWIGHSTLTAIANAIREKTGDTALLLPGAMAQAIGGISVGTKVYEGAVTAPGSAWKNFTFTIEHGLGHVPVFFALVPSMTGYGDNYYLANVWASGCNGFDSGVVSSDADDNAILESFRVDLTGARPVNVTTFNNTTVTFNKMAGNSPIRGTFKVVMF